MGCKVIIVCETSNAIHGQDDVAVNDRPRLTDSRVDRPSGRASRRWRSMRQRRASRWSTTTTWARSSRRSEEIDRLMAETGPATHLLFDTGHCYFGGGDPVRLAKRHMARVRHIHAKNVRPAVTARGARAGAELPGRRAARRLHRAGRCRRAASIFTPVLEVAAGHGYDGWLVIEAEQDPAVRDPVEYQTHGAARAEGVCAGARGSIVRLRKRGPGASHPRTPVGYL